MSNSSEHVSMALFCDFENVALGVRDTKYQKFDIRPVLERLLLKGSIVVKKAYCDWERYKDFKAPMHEANFELIEIPHVRQSGKNSADIRLVVDALDFCYTKSHVNTFVIISGDSDFSPLVSKLRENNKTVIGVGVKQSTSDLLVANCDEFIFYDDLAREMQRASESRRDNRSPANPAQRRTPDEERVRKEELEHRRTQAVEMVAETFEALMSERGDSGKIWASVLKDALKRRRPDFNEAYYGFRAFGNLLEEAQSRGLLEVGRAENSSTYVFRNGSQAADESSADMSPAPTSNGRDTQPRQESRRGPGRRSGGSGRDHRESRATDNAPAEQYDDALRVGAPTETASATESFADEARDGRANHADEAQGAPSAMPATAPQAAPTEGSRKSSSRGRRRSRSEAASQAVAQAEARSDAVAEQANSQATEGNAPVADAASARDVNRVETPAVVAAPSAPIEARPVPTVAAGASRIPVAAPTVMASRASTRSSDSVSDEPGMPAAPAKRARARKRTTGADSSTTVQAPAESADTSSTEQAPAPAKSSRRSPRGKAAAPSAPQETAAAGEAPTAAKRTSKTARKSSTQGRRARKEGDEAA
jgi:uncharacterized LabA/DUF88 family protein